MPEEELERLRRLPFCELAHYIVDNRDRAFAAGERDALLDNLENTLWHLGQLWDLVTGTNPRQGHALYGAPNHHSMTYKCRKLAGFSYP